MIPGFLKEKICLNFNNTLNIKAAKFPDIWEDLTLCYYSCLIYDLI